MDYQHYLDEINALDDYLRLGIAVVLMSLALMLAKYAVIRPWWRFVTSTDADWDDYLHRPLANRTYALILAVGSQMTIRWILGTASSTYETTEPVFAAFYIILSASILSVSINPCNSFSQFACTFGSATCTRSACIPELSILCSHPLSQLSPVSILHTNDRLT